MANGFDWVPFYEEMATKLLNYQAKQADLVNILADSGVRGLEDKDIKGKRFALTEIDPFTFLAMLNKQSHPVRIGILSEVKIHLEIKSPVPSGFLGIPKADPRQTWLFPYKSARKIGDIPALWMLYREVLSGKPLSNQTFANARSVKYAGKAKLTQAIFRAAPTRFFPVDGQTTSYLARLRLPNDFNSAKEFQDICAQVSKCVTKPLYEQSHDAWFLNQKKRPNAEAEYQKTALQKAAVNTNTFVENKGGVPLPKLKKSGLNGKSYDRDPKVAASALKKAKFKCEIDAAHQTFISNSKNKPYVEAHHLIPFSNQGSYDFSLDVTANIVALCPNCHRRLHHGKKTDKAKDISKLFRQRIALLQEKELKISEKELIALYKGELLEEDA